MLYEFLETNHDDLVTRCRRKVTARQPPPTARAESAFGIPVLLAQLVAELRAESTAKPEATEGPLSVHIGQSAGKHGSELLRRGFTIEQVVHDYGDLCQAVTELAHEKGATISVSEFHTFNRCLDNAIAEAVTEFGRQRDRGILEDRNQSMNERLGFLAHELRNLLNSATLAYQALKSGQTAIGGATGAILGRSLTGLRDVIDRTLADVRLTEGMNARREEIFLRDLLDETQVYAAMEAKARDITFTIAPFDDALVVFADRQMLSSAVFNLLQNAFKFTHANGNVSITASRVEGRILIEIEDECGGLVPGRTEELFQPFTQRSGDRTGLGLGLSISRRGIEANGGKVYARSLPGKGCVFTIELPTERRALRT